MFGEARIVIVASHAHAMYKPISKGKIDFESLGMEGSKTIENFAEVQASLQRLVQLFILRLRLLCVRE